VDYLAQPVVFFFTLWIAGFLWWINAPKTWKTCVSSVPNYRSKKVTRGNFLGFTFALQLTETGRLFEKRKKAGRLQET
jgi:hypothetical protein